MPKTRIELADQIAGALLPTKRNTVEAAAGQAELLAVLLRARLAARGQPGEGSDIISLVQDGLNRMVEAQECQQRAHALLAPMREALSIPAMRYGDDDTPPSRPQAHTGLELVKAA